MTERRIQPGDRETVSGRLAECHREDDSDVAAVRLTNDADDDYWVAFPESHPARSREWERGALYRLEGVRGIDPVLELQSRHDRVQSALDPVLDTVDELGDVTVGHCPDCGGVVDIDAVVGVDESVQSVLRAIDTRDSGVLADDGVVSETVCIDDWQPAATAEITFGTPSERRNVVCLECGTDVSAEIEALSGQSTLPPSAVTAVQSSRTDQSAVTRLGASGAETACYSADASESVGMATGGAKDATNFRDNVREGYVPQPDSLAYEGLFYDYYFDTGDNRDEDALFYPSYSRAVTEHPLTGETEQYLTVGLNSNLTESDLERKPLNLVAVVDISGSMASQFDQYYYDEHGRRRETDSTDTMTKMAAARRALSALTEQLDPDDRFGVVLYNSQSHVAKPLRSVADTDMDAIRGHIEDISSSGGTDMSAGFDAAMDLLEPHHDAPRTEVENRVVFMTDAMPNTGTVDEGDITDRFADASERNVHTTFVGIGLDTNADLVESISGVPGANHYFVHSTDEFTERLADEFTYMVTPLVFDLSLDVVSDGYEIDAVFGSPNADRATGEVMHVETLFPSPTSDGETRGGVTLLRLRQTDPDAPLRLSASWQERDGTEGHDEVTVSFPDDGPEAFDNSGIRKAVLLARYGELLREWMVSERRDERSPEGPVDDWIAGDDIDLGQWEQQSVPLSVSEAYQTEFRALRQHFGDERATIGGDDLQRDETILELLADPDRIDSADTSTDRTTENSFCGNCAESLDEHPGATYCPHCGTHLQ